MARVAQNDSEGSDSGPAGLTEFESRVCGGLRVGEFHLMFQGAYKAASGELARVKAQVRWAHPDYGFLLPGIFAMPIEHPAVMQEMASFVVNAVCRELRSCIDAKLPLRPMAIALPAQIALLGSFADDPARVAESYCVPLGLFEIEVADSAEAVKLLSLRLMTEGLRESGVGLALSEWGNGASSLALLGSLDVDTITVARELMGAVPRNERAAMVMASMMDLLCALGGRVVVNGVDTLQQLQWLRQWPEALAQGMAFSPLRGGLANVLELLS